MNRRYFLAGVLPAIFAPPALGQWHDLIEAGQQFLEQNLDPGLVRALQSGDARQTQAVLVQMVQRLQGEYVLDLASMEETGEAALAILEAQPETRPYASWLRARADYFDVADRFRKALPSPQGPPGHPPPPVIPTPEQERTAWQRQMEGRPRPTGATTWVPRLKPIFRKAGTPAELVWVAEIESSFDPEARSPVGAAGLYQLMPNTAEGLGLKLKPQDERLVPTKNAAAAASYLRQLNRQFKDWRLALAAYNAGPGRVSDVLNRRRARSFDAIAPSLPAETQMYVPKLEAVLKRREGVALGSLKAPVAV